MTDASRRLVEVAFGCRSRIVKPENIQAIDFQRLSEYKLRRFRVEIGGFLTSAALSADFGAIKGPEGKERMPRTARCGRMLAEKRYGCLQNFYKYRTAPFMDAVLARSAMWPTASILSAHAAPKR